MATTLTTLQVPIYGIPGIPSMVMNIAVMNIDVDIGPAGQNIYFGPQTFMTQVAWIQPCCLFANSVQREVL